MKDAGFTLVELLVVVAVIGLLAAIALPQYAAYRQRGFDARALTDLRNAATGEEAYFSAWDTYIDCIGRPACESILPGFSGAPGVDLAMFWVSDTQFSGRSFHPEGSRNSLVNAYMWNSSQGGLQ